MLQRVSPLNNAHLAAAITKVYLWWGYQHTFFQISSNASTPSWTFFRHRSISPVNNQNTTIQLRS